MAAYGGTVAGEGNGSAPRGDFARAHNRRAGVWSIFHRMCGFSTAPLVRYLAAATLVRAADGGAAVGLVLLGGPRLGGLLAACLTAPHLVGPALARRLDSARDDARCWPLPSPPTASRSPQPRRYWATLRPPSPPWRPPLRARAGRC
jgi:hypothetical protein